MRVQVAEGFGRQAQAAADRPRRAGGEGDARALQHVDHAEEAHRVVARDAVVDIGDHQLGGQRRLAAAHRRGVGAAGGEVVEDPLLVAALLVDVLRDRAAQPFETHGQARAAGHQQRYGVADVVIGLGEEGDVARQRDLADERLLDNRRGEQHVAFGHGLVLELLEEAHVSVSSLKEVK